MKIILNGQEKDASKDITVSFLLDELGINRERVAVELNLYIIPKANFAETVLKDGDRVEIVSFVGGGQI